MGWYVKLRERKFGGGGTSWPHPIMVAFSPPVGERAGSQGPRVVRNYKKFYELFLKLLFNLINIL